MKGKRGREDPCGTCGHYHDYENGEPCAICGHVLVTHTLQHESVMPTTLVPGFLYLGNYDTASRQEILKAFNITHVLNMVTTSTPLYKNSFTHHTVTSNPPDFEECFTFLDGVKAQNTRVLMYCMSATSKSPTIAIGYLMKLHGWRLAEAYKWVKDKRPNINLSAADQQRLVDLEMGLYHTCSVPLGFAALSMPALGSPAPARPSHPQPNPAAGATASPAPAASPGFFSLGGCSAFKVGQGAPSGGGFVFGGPQPQQQEQHALHHMQQQQQEQAMET